LADPRPARADGSASSAQARRGKAPRPRAEWSRDGEAEAGTISSSARPSAERQPAGRPAGTRMKGPGAPGRARSRARSRRDGTRGGAAPSLAQLISPASQPVRKSATSSLLRSIMSVCPLPVGPRSGLRSGDRDPGALVRGVAHEQHGARFRSRLAAQPPKSQGRPACLEDVCGWPNSPECSSLRNAVRSGSGDRTAAGSVSSGTDLRAPGLPRSPGGPRWPSCLPDV